MNKFSEVWKRQSVYSATEETTKAMDWFLIRTDGFEHSRWPTKVEAEEMCEQLRAQGIYGTIIRESVVDATTKAVGNSEYGEGTTQDNVTKHNGDEINFCAEYKDKYGHVNHRFFNSKDQLDQFKAEMGKEITITQIIKTMVQKPGPSRHTEKWDRCIADVEAKGGANAYAVCTAQLGEDSFKSGQFDVGEVDRYLDLFGKQVGIEYAGPSPQSLLGRQDLAGKEVKAVDDSDDDTVNKSFGGFTPTYELAERIKANQKPAARDYAGKTFKDMWQRVRSTNKLKA